MLGGRVRWLGGRPVGGTPGATVARYGTRRAPSWHSRSAASIRYPSFQSPWSCEIRRADGRSPTRTDGSDRLPTRSTRAVARSTIMTISFWLRRPAPGPRPALRGALRADVAIVGAGFTGLWTAIRLAETDPTLRIVVVEAGLRRVRGERSERRLLRGEPRPRTGQRRAPLPRRDRPARTARPGEPPGAAGVHPRPTRSTAISRRPACSTVADQPHGVPELRAWVDESNARGERARLPRSRRGPGRGPLAPLAGRRPGRAGRRGDARPDQAVRRAGPGRRPSSA